MSKRGGYLFYSCAVCLFFVFNSSLTAQEQPAIPQQVLDWQKAAQACFDQKDYVGAREKYQQILQTFPDAIWSQQGLACSLIWLGNLAAAQVETNKLLVDYSTHPEITTAMGRVANSYHDTGHYTEAVQLYRTAVKYGPSAPDAIWSQRGLACSLIRLGDHVAAQTETSKLFAEYSTHREIAMAVGQTADNYYNTGYYTEAMQLYQAVVKRGPSDPNAIWSRRGLACSLIWLGDLAAAQVETNKLLVDYSTHREIAMAMGHVANSYHDTGHYTEAVQLYRAAVKHGPNAPDAIWSQRGLACSLIRLRDFAAAQVEMNKLLTAYSNHRDLATAVGQVADNYRELQLYQEALALYRKALEMDSSPAEQCNIHVGIARVYVAQGDDAAAQAEVDYLLSNFKDNLSGVAFYMLGIGEEYYLAGQKTDNDALFYKSIALLKDIPLATNQNKHSVASVQYMLGLNYQYVGEYLNAASAFENAYAAEPKFRYAEYCLFSVGNCYEKLLKQNLVSEIVGKAFIRGTYTQFVQIYPDSKNTPHVREWLKNNPDNKGI